MGTENDQRGLIATASFTAGLIIAQQIAGKATREALFLSTHDVVELPVMIMAASAVAIALVPIVSRALVKWGPAWLVPSMFVLSAGGYLLEWWVAHMAPDTAASVLYLHQAATGPVLISGFWLLVNERMDPRAARAAAPKIATGATIGGFAGGIAVERLSLFVDASLMMPIIAGLQIGCFFLLLLLRPRERAESSDGPALSALTVLKSNRYLREMGILLLIATTGTGLLEYVLRDGAAAAYGSAELLRFFAVFYTVLGAATLAAQALVARRWLAVAGPANTAGAMPVALAVGALGLVIVGGLIPAILAVGLVRVTESSLFRTGYEVLYSPVPEAERRAARTANDVWFGKAGDWLAGLLIQGVLFLGVAQVTSILAAAAIALGVGAYFIVVRLRRGYLEGLANRVVEAAEASEEATPAISRGAMATIGIAAMQTHGGQELLPEFGGQLLTQLGPPSKRAPGVATPPKGPAPEARPSDLIVARVAQLRSNDESQIRDALSMPLRSHDVSHAVALLAHPSLSSVAFGALRDRGSEVSGQLLDALLNRRNGPSVRRRVARLLSEMPKDTVAVGLVEALDDPRFDVCFQCAHALLRVREALPAVRIDESRITEIVKNHLAEPSPTSRPAAATTVDADSSADERAARDRFKSDSGRHDPHLEYVFVLLATIRPVEPLVSAYTSISSADRRRSGAAYEYLSSVLPADVWEPLERRVESATAQ